MNKVCPLCKSNDTALLIATLDRDFSECAVCDLLFVSPSQFLSKEEEKKRYDLHKNDSNDLDYRAFLSRIKNPLITKLTRGMRGLDFGCGNSNTMSTILEENGFQMERFDPFFGPALVKTEIGYDFITCSEVVEHFRKPESEFRLLHSLLKTNGWLAIATNLRDEYRNDENWWYLRDRTHICFYSRKTFIWLGTALGFRLENDYDNIVLLQKN
jgi:hypothetical protein